MDIAKVKEIVLSIIANTDYTLYDVKLDKIDNNDILQIFIDKAPAISIDELANLNEQISTALDKIDSSWPPYMLEVSSPGAEKELRNKDEIIGALGKYIHIEVAQGIYEGYLEAVNDNDLVVKINLKGRIKKQPILYQDIKFIRLAVKI